MITLILACSQAPSKDKIFSITKAALQNEKLSYYSDYFSFIGRDEHGFVAFALDNNRGQDKDEWQAEHFLVLYDSGSGWRELIGNGDYENGSRLLTTIPDSRNFSFEGGASTGYTITSKTNNLTLQTQSLSSIIKNKQGISRYEMNVANATLNWNGRTLQGRVIHEFLFLPAFNRLSRTYTNVFDDFQGIYAIAGELGDLYIHTQVSDFLSLLTMQTDAFVVQQGQPLTIKNVSIRTTKRAQAWGFYSNPVAWEGTIETENGNATFVMQLVEPNKIANWIVGGFTMGIVKGVLRFNEKDYPILGLGELII